jgi:hypothetical protein
MGDFYDWSDVPLSPLPPNFMEEFLSSLEPMPNVNQTFNYIPTSSSYHHQPPVLQHPHLVMPIETFGPASAPDSVPAWSASSNDTEASHSRIVSSVNTPSSTHSIPEQKKRVSPLPFLPFRRNALIMTDSYRNIGKAPHARTPPTTSHIPRSLQSVLQLLPTEKKQI